MPRTIWQQNEYQYIGDQIWTFDGEGNQSVAQVYDRDTNCWIRINTTLTQVDHWCKEVGSTSYTFGWKTERTYSTLHIVVSVNGQEVYAATASPSDEMHTVSGLTSETTYTINVYADYVQGGRTDDNFTEFTTTTVVVPSAPQRLTQTAWSNSSISLAWDAPAYGPVSYYAVFMSEGFENWRQVATTTSRSRTVSALKSDTKYRFAVRAVNRDGQASPLSNDVRLLTGHEEKRRTGKARNVALPPKRWGSWRGDIGWNWWASWPEKDANQSIYQGYWAYRSKRYWGVIEYDDAELRRILDRKYGVGVGDNFNVTRASIRRVYRQRMAGNYAPQTLVWHLTNSRVRGTNARPTVYERHVNDANTADKRRSQRAIRAGTSIKSLRIPRAWAEAIIRGRRKGNQPVSGLVLYRDDDNWNGYGYAGYMKISGHKQPDYHLGGAGGRSSDLTLVVQGNWDFRIQSYKAPSSW